MESCSRIKDGNMRLALGEDEVPGIWKEYFEDLYHIDTQEQVAVHRCGFDRVQKLNYFEGETSRRTGVELRVRKLKNRKAAAKEEVTRETAKVGNYMMVKWPLRVIQCLRARDLL